MPILKLSVLFAPLFLQKGVIEGCTMYMTCCDDPTLPIGVAGLENNRHKQRTEPASSSSIKKREEPVWVSKVQSNERFLKAAPYHIRNNKKIVMAAVRRHGSELEFATPQLQNDKDVVLAAVRQDINALQWATSGMQEDKDVKALECRYHKKNLSAVQENGFALENVPRYQNNRQIVLAAVRKNGGALEYATPEIQGDKQVVLAAVQQDGTALEFASPELQSDKQVVVAAVHNDNCGLALKHAHKFLQGDKEVALAAVKQHPNAIKYIHEDLKRDPDVLIASCMFDDDHDAIRQQGTKIKKIAFSTRFSLSPTSDSQATNFTALFKVSEYVVKDSFMIYAPNAFDKKTCDPCWTDFNWRCRGTKDTQYNNTLTEIGRPTDDCCWRYSFRSQLEEAKKTGGFMLQLVETGKDFGKVDDATLGMGQMIELDMAHAVGTKVFQVYRPSTGKYEQWFQKSHIDVVTEEISRWYKSQCQDMSVTVICPEW